MWTVCRDESTAYAAPHTEMNARIATATRFSHAPLTPSAHQLAVVGEHDYEHEPSSSSRLTIPDADAGVTPSRSASALVLTASPSRRSSA